MSQIIHPCFVAYFIGTPPPTSRSTGKCHPHRKVPDCTIPIQEAAKLLSLLVKVPIILESHVQNLLLYVVRLNSQHHNSFLAATHLSIKSRWQKKTLMLPHIIQLHHLARNCAQPRLIPPPPTPNKRKGREVEKS